VCGRSFVLCRTVVPPPPCNARCMCLGCAQLRSLSPFGVRAIFFRANRPVLSRPDDPNWPASTRVDHAGCRRLPCEFYMTVGAFSSGSDELPRANIIMVRVPPPYRPNQIFRWFTWRRRNCVIPPHHIILEYPPSLFFVSSVYTSFATGPWLGEYVSCISAKYRPRVFRSHGRRRRSTPWFKPTISKRRARGSRRYVVFISFVTQPNQPWPLIVCFVRRRPTLLRQTADAPPDVLTVSHGSHQQQRTFRHSTRPRVQVAVFVRTGGRQKVCVLP